MRGREVLLATTPPQRLQLSAKPIGRGGQATVYSTDTDTTLAVKVYHRPSDEVERRLRGMLLLGQQEDFLTQDTVRHPVLAWPAAAVKDPNEDRVIGYAMRRVGRPEFVPLGMLFNSSQRREHFPEISWRFLIGIGRNLSALVAALHEREMVLGDVSHGNFVVSGNGYLTFLDCDSMQFTDPDTGEKFPCPVLTAEYAPPELRRGEAPERTPTTDNFSLAVLVIRLLLVGDHPFMGTRPHGHGGDEVGTAENVRDGFCYLVRPEEMMLPAGALNVGLLPPDVLQLGRRAFGPGHSNPQARPTAIEWLSALDDALASLVVCPAHPTHVHSGHLSACPWCERVAAGHPDLFAGRPESRRSGAGPTKSPRPSGANGQALQTALRVAIGLLLILGAFVLLAVLLSQ
jgi:DNA-binding helix-hairpin-helix protein with protein kinase domain